jgi:Kef-type K+ transport system membrane component KefB
MYMIDSPNPAEGQKQQAEETQTWPRYAIAIICAVNGAILAACGCWGAWLVGFDARGMHALHMGLQFGAALSVVSLALAISTSKKSEKWLGIGRRLAMLLQVIFTAVAAVNARQAWVAYMHSFKSQKERELEKGGRFHAYVLMGFVCAFSLGFILCLEPSKPNSAKFKGV